MPRKTDKQTLPKGLVEALAKKPVGIDSGELLAAITRAWGGPTELATDIRQEFMDAGGGSMTRARILEMIQRLVLVTTDREVYKSKSPSDMTDTELQAFAKEYLKRISEVEAEKGDAEAEEGSPEAEG